MSTKFQSTQVSFGENISIKIDENLDTLDQKLKQIITFKISLTQGVMPDGCETKEKAQQALQLLHSEVYTLLNDINTALKNTNPDENTLFTVDINLIDDAAHLVGGHPITENPLLK